VLNVTESVLFCESKVCQ